MDRKTILIITFILATILFTSCKRIDISKKRVLYFSVFPADTTEKTYLFEIYNNKEMICTKGVRDWEINEKIRFEEIEQNKIVTLSDEYFKNILKIIDDINKCGNRSYQEGIYNDALVILVVTEENRQTRYYDIENECDELLSKLFKIMEKISPLEILFQF